MKLEVGVTHMLRGEEVLSVFLAHGIALPTGQRILKWCLQKSANILTKVRKIIISINSLKQKRNIEI